jgi:hypothetical protein
MIGKNYKIIIKKLYDILLSKSQRPKLLVSGLKTKKCPTSDQQAAATAEGRR